MDGLCILFSHLKENMEDNVVTSTPTVADRGLSAYHLRFMALLEKSLYKGDPAVLGAIGGWFFLLYVLHLPFCLWLPVV